jgi:cytochrome c-type biogenesis protein CcsB
MNNILNYKGYRFFQSSYDQDELGTVLSVNHDAWGTWVSYLGYFLLTLGLILTLFSPKSRFRQLSNQLKRMHMSAKPVMTLMALLISSALWSQSSKDAINNLPEVSAEHAAKFGKMIVQDHRGRMKPMNTMASEVLRKIARKESIHGQNADQVFIGMIVFPDQWIQVPLIKLGRHEEVKNILNVDGPLVSYNDFFQDGYKLRDYGKEAHSKEPQDRGAFDKEIIKLDEKVNICNMVFASRLMRLFPEPNHPGNQWISPGEVSHQSNPSQETPDFHAFFNGYKASVLQAVKTQDWSQADQFLDELVSFQEKFGSAVLPNDSKISLEIWLNKMNVFGRLGRYYGLFGLLFLFTFFITVFKSNLSPVWPLRIGMLLMAALFLLHTTGLGVRWYVSGRAPWSNGYESMIYIAWTTALAGLVFARRTFGGLAATAVLASTILMVAGLSWMDPEITPLVPVLKSYWLTIHVSLEAGSYGFLMLGAIIGILNLLLMIFTSRHNDQRNYRKIRELTLISEMTLIAGLVMVSVGTYLGGVWANESWGRYWGWDAKETWALVTILVYTFILHMRFIPGLRGLYAFNLASLFGFASVMMTYFGVNYYLSGLHSYAAGDPVPIPPSVYYTAAIFALIGILAYWKFRQHQNEYVSKSSVSQETV